jgi:hypothetical protein
MNGNLNAVLLAASLLLGGAYCLRVGHRAIAEGCGMVRDQVVAAWQGEPEAEAPAL